MKPIKPVIEVKAITKEEVSDNLKNRSFPPFVIQAFNECIEESKIQHSDNVLRNTVVAKIIQIGNVTEKDIMDNHWLDVEEFYRKAGWKVSYTKPAYNEDYKAFFTFK